MPSLLIIHGGIGAGKTTTAVELAARARLHGLKVAGILSRRVFEAGEVVGYDAQDVGSPRTFPLVRRRGLVCGADWDALGNSLYAFSAEGFREANTILSEAVGRLDERTFLFLDEYGRVESQGQGLRPSVEKILESLPRGGTAIFLCRTDMVNEVLALASARIKQVFCVEAGDPVAAWRFVSGRLEPR